MEKQLEKLRPVNPARARARFLIILPRIRRHATIYFRRVRCPHHQEDLVAEAVALAWKWFVRLEERGKDATRFPSVLATFAARAVRCGRRVCGQLPARDVLSEAAQQRHGFAVGKLPDCSTLNGNPLEEALTDNTQTPPPDQVQFRIDFPTWVGTHTRRHRRMIGDMAMGERTILIAKNYKLSQARVSQLRRQFAEHYREFLEPKADRKVA